MVVPVHYSRFPLFFLVTPSTAPSPATIAGCRAASSTRTQRSGPRFPSGGVCSRPGAGSISRTGRRTRRAGRPRTWCSRSCLGCTCASSITCTRSCGRAKLQSTTGLWCSSSFHGALDATTAVATNQRSKALRPPVGDAARDAVLPMLRHRAGCRA